MSAKDLKDKNPWIKAYRSQVNVLETYPENIQLVDTENNGENKLIVAEQKKRLAFYKGTLIEWETKLPAQPSALGYYYVEVPKSKNIPIIAVACEKYIFMYKNRKKYIRLSMPTKNVTSHELSLWKEYNGDPEGLNTFLMALNTLKNNGVQLSYVSQNILMLESQKDQLVFYNKSKDIEQQTSDTATCMVNLRRTVDEEGQASNLVIGTEFGALLILSNSGDIIEQNYQLEETPIKMIATGTLEGIYNIYVQGRNMKLFIFSHGETIFTVNLAAEALGFLRIGNCFFVGYYEGNIDCLTAKGLTKLRSINQSSELVCMETMHYSKLNEARGLIVALKNKELKIYDKKGVTLLNVIKLDDIVICMKFGKIGREDGCLFLCYKTTGIEILIQKREFCQNMNAFQTIQNEEEKLIKLPEKSKFFLEQLEADRERAPEIYKTYQKDIIKLKLIVNESYEKMQSKGQISSQSSESIKIHVTIEGLGPRFKLAVRLTNESMKPLTDIRICLNYSTEFYRLDSPLPAIGALLPFATLPIEIFIENIEPNGATDPIKIYILNKKSKKPMAGSIIAMPISDIEGMN